MERARAELGEYREGQYEFQCLHGMGEPLYEQLVGSGVGEQRPCRIYAPVGTHETPLAYLVRRLLENGANTSFVNRVANEDIALETLVEDPLVTVQALREAEGVEGDAHPGIALPQDLLGPARRNSKGLDLNDEAVIAQREAQRAQGPTLADLPLPRDAASEEVDAAVEAAARAFGPWSSRPPEERAAVLEAAADRFEAQGPQWLHLLAGEAGKTAVNGVAEVREAVDFLRYYAQQLHECARLGPVQALWEAGVPQEALQLVCGAGETVGARLVANERVQGVLFTGST